MSNNNKTIYSPLGASNHSSHDREANDFYATPPYAVEKLLELEDFSPLILEPCCGAGHISKVLEAHGHTVISQDLYDRGYGVSGCDFLSNNTGIRAIDGDIITNPPYRYAQEFVEKALSIIPEGCKVAMFLKLLFLEGKSRRAMFDANPPKVVYVSSSRLSCGINGEFGDASSAVAYAWFVWEKGYKGDPIIKWFN